MCRKDPDLRSEGSYKEMFRQVPRDRALRKVCERT